MDKTASEKQEIKWDPELVAEILADESSWMVHDDIDELTAKAEGLWDCLPDGEDDKLDGASDGEVFLQERNAIEATTELLLSMIAIMLDAKILSQQQVFLIMETAVARLKNPESQEYLREFIVDRITANPKWTGGS